MEINTQQWNVSVPKRAKPEMAIFRNFGVMFLKKSDLGMAELFCRDLIIASLDETYLQLILPGKLDFLRGGEKSFSDFGDLYFFPSDSYFLSYPLF